MKKLNFTFILLALGLMSQAQPQKINYQAVAVNANGVTVKSRVISLRLSILDSSSTGSVLYSEIHQPTTDGGGQFSVFLGGGTAVSGTFSNIPWGNTKDKFLKAEADLNGGTNYVLMGVSQIVSVPYALAAGSLSDSSKVTASDGTEWSLIVGPNGPEWQQSSGPGGLKMNFPCPGVSSVTYGGQTYKTVQIGNQCWFKENLNVGTMIQGANDQTNNSIFEKYCYNNLTAYCDTFGGLYQWAEAVQYQNGASNTISPNPAFSGNLRGICPIGWHIPTIIEWGNLFIQFGTNNSLGTIEATSLKSRTFWDYWSPSIFGNNSSGFSLLPTAYCINNRFNDVGFSQSQGKYGYYLSGDYPDSSSFYFFQFSYISNYSVLNTTSKGVATGIRCLKD